jgi:hypothetical protein
VRAELVVDRVVVALAEQMEVQFGELRGKPVGVVLVYLVAIAVPDVQPVRLRGAAPGHAAFEEARRMHRLQRDTRLVVPDHLDGHGVGLEHADHAQRVVAVATRELVITEQRTRRRVTRVHQRFDVSRSQSRDHVSSLACFARRPHRDCPRPRRRGRDAAPRRNGFRGDHASH